MMKLAETNPITQLENLLEFAPIAIGVFDAESQKTLLLNDAFQRLFGYTLSDIPDMDTWHTKSFATSDSSTPAFSTWLTKAELNTPSSCLTASVRIKDGRIRQISVSLTLAEGKKFFYVNDITDHLIIEQRLQAHNDMLEMVAKSSSLKDVLTVIVQQVQRESPPSLCSVLLYDKQKQCLWLGAAPNFPEYYNQAIHGIQVGPNIGSCGAAAYHNRHIIVEDINTHPNWQAFTELTQKAGLTSCWSDPIRAADGTLLGTFAIYNSPSPSPSQKDIEQIQFASNLASIAIENHNAHQELERRAYFDYLTGLANRRSFFELSSNMLKQASVLKENCALLMMDVDHFKKINDIHGHDLGDLVLKHLAKNSLSNLPEGAIMGRIGGEEFAILLPDTDRAAASNIAESLRKSLSDTSFISHEGQTIHYTVSIGMTFSLGLHCYIDELLREADSALYKAKQTGRNRVCTFTAC
ncbi:sensor domain-containing diguanylate cyclase [Marinomonas pollencensis]|uniref:diguanylate cyclase n=1 Tax=Marinomonas pollencensis TaxID=491954 RepID=A0A3E0DNV1_9GAMM|nr:diguanylate cyclase [Marinomonas pollencensis]REG83829.1 diguanylate cyclase with GAF sensor [Marinomonas pollencensis]